MRCHSLEPPSLFPPGDFMTPTNHKKLQERLCRDDLGDRLRAIQDLKARMTVSESGCWIWAGCRDRQGYGSTTLFRIPIGTHRLSYILHVGPIASDLRVLHKCDNPPCFNPEHLFLGTMSDNSQDMHRKGRAACSGRNPCVPKLTWDDVIAIRSSTEPRKVLADRYSVTWVTIHHIKTYKTWKSQPTA